MLLPLLLLTACTQPLPSQGTLPERIAEIGCISECRATKERCDADARFDYQQCQTGYTDAFRTYRWCLASAADRADCGYPWWSCAENLFGYCTNRFNECQRACRDAE